MTLDLIGHQSSEPRSVYSGFLSLALLTASAAENPPPETPGWMLAATVVLAATGWWMHWRWRTGRYFMGRFTTHEREAAKLASIGYIALPAAIGATAMAALVALFTCLSTPTPGSGCCMW